MRKDRTMFIYAGKPSESYKSIWYRTKIQINDAFANITDVKPAVFEFIAGTREELKDKIVVGLKVDKNTNAGLVSDIKQELREANALKVMYIANQTPRITSLNLLKALCLLKSIALFFILMLGFS